MANDSRLKTWKICGPCSPDLGKACGWIWLSELILREGKEALNQLWQGDPVLGMKGGWSAPQA